MWEMYIDTQHIHYSPLRKKGSKGGRDEEKEGRKEGSTAGRGKEVGKEGKKEGRKKEREEERKKGRKEDRKRNPSYGGRWKGITTNCINCFLCRARTKLESVKSPAVMRAWHLCPGLACRQDVTELLLPGSQCKAQNREGVLHAFKHRDYRCCHCLGLPTNNAPS